MKANQPTTAAPQFTTEERALILAALRAVSPTGGGSHQFTLFRKLADEWSDIETNFGPINDVIIKMIRTPYCELKEEIENNPGEYDARTGKHI